MTRNRWPRNGKPRRDLAGRQLSALQVLKNLPPCRISQRAKRTGRRFHVSSLAILLNSVKALNACRCPILVFAHFARTGWGF
jgi:hypothetical protein